MQPTKDNLMPSSDTGKSRILQMIADELPQLAQQDPYARRLPLHASGADAGWRALLAPVWLRVEASGVDFAALDDTERRRFLRGQVRWAARDLLRASSKAATRHASGTQAEDLPDPSPPAEIHWAQQEDTRVLMARVRVAWRALPAFDRAVLALYAGCPCEHDASLALADRLGLGVAELVARARAQGVVGGGLPGKGEGKRGGRRGRQGQLSRALQVTPSRVHQWTCRARTNLLREIRRSCDGTPTGELPAILARLLG